MSVARVFYNNLQHLTNVDEIAIGGLETAIGFFGPFPLSKELMQGLQLLIDDLQKIHDVLILKKKAMLDEIELDTQISIGVCMDEISKVPKDSKEAHEAYRKVEKLEELQKLASNKIEERLGYQINRTKEILENVNKKIAPYK